MSRVRSKSRSPLPASNLNNKSLTTPRFLPPSHYAAAAGLAPRRQLSINDRRVGIDFYEDPNDQFATAFMPTTYPSDAESSSDSSFEFKASIAGNEKLAGADRRGRRQSLINDIPQLEANLLPSLRDTIDRMTKSPHLAVPKPTDDRRGYRSPSPTWNSIQNPPATSYFEEYPTSRHIVPPLDTSMMEPLDETTSADILTPKTNLPARSTLKSTLRPPTPRKFSKTSSSEPFSEPPTGSVRGILKKSAISSSTTPFSSESTFNRPSTMIMNQSIKTPSRPIRSRSRTDPGTVPTITFDNRSSTARDAPSNKQTSGIARPRKRSGSTQSQWSTDGSDIENQYEARVWERRHLVVGNAEAIPSRLKSESEERAKAATSGSEYLKSHQNSWEEGRVVGLGFDFEPDAKRHEGGSKKEKGGPSRPDTPLRVGRRLETPRTPRRRSSRSTDRNTVDLKPHRISPPLRDVSNDHEKHRKALMGIVSRLSLVKQQSLVSGEAASDGDSKNETISEYHAANRAPTPHQQTSRGETHHEQDKTEPSAVQSQKERPISSSGTPKPTRDPTSPLLVNRYLSSSQGHTVSSTVKGARRLPTTSRSPVVAQIDPNAIPAAIRRHSVYLRPMYPVLPPPDKTDDSQMDRGGAGINRVSTGIDRDRHGKVQDGPSPSQHPYKHRDSGVDIPATPSWRYSAALRERKAYGLPPSDSIGGYQENNYPIPHDESDLSSVGSVYLDDNSESELSPAAETLFKKLGSASSKENRRNHQLSSGHPTRAGGNSRATSPLPTVQATDFCWESNKSTARRDDLRSRRSTPPLQAPHDMPGKLDKLDIEAKRQDLVLEFYNTEQDFVKRLRAFVQLFILPLRIQDTKEWISGVLPELARLFDWLEDIVVFHTQILASLESARAVQYPTVVRIAESIRICIPRLEVYQPYLVKLVEAMTLIEQLLKDEESDFGEFIRLQEASPECDGWNFQNFLIEPVNLLSRFPEYFLRLLELTPKSHKDYLSTFALVHTTNMFVRVMAEVKTREDEYDLIHKISARIQGLSPAAQLATRDRRLLHQGTIYLQDVEANDLTSYTGPSKLSHYFPLGTAGRNINAGNRTSRLATENSSKWTMGCSRSESTSSSSTGVSYNSINFAGGVPTEDSIFFSSFRIPLPQGRLKQATLKTPASPTPASGNSDVKVPTSYGTAVQAFVFTDLVILAVPSSAGPTSGNADEWTLLNYIGTIRILSVELQDTESHDPGAIILEALPVNAHILNQTSNLDDGSVFLLRLVLAWDESQIHTDNTTPQASNPGKGLSHAWISAFRRCQCFTLCSLSIPSRNHDPKADMAFDKQRAVFSLIASGLPLPKSPSMQIADAQQGDEMGDVVTQEREERGWWSLRFQQIFRELQREDMALASVDMGI